MNGAQWLVQALRKQRVETVFGYPGGAIMPVYDALYDGGVEHVLCRHEQEPLSLLSDLLVLPVQLVSVSRHQAQALLMSSQVLLMHC